LEERTKSLLEGALVESAQAGGLALRGSVGALIVVICWQRFGDHVLAHALLAKLLLQQPGPTRAVRCALLHPVGRERRVVYELDAPETLDHTIDDLDVKIVASESVADLALAAGTGA
jgi:hypothetical protein